MGKVMGSAASRQWSQERKETYFHQYWVLPPPQKKNKGVLLLKLEILLKGGTAIVVIFCFMLKHTYSHHNP